MVAVTDGHLDRGTAVGLRHAGLAAPLPPARPGRQDPLCPGDAAAAVQRLVPEPSRTSLRPSGSDARRGSGSGGRCGAPCSTRSSPSVPSRSPWSGCGASCGCAAGLGPSPAWASGSATCAGRSPVWSRRSTGRIAAAGGEFHLSEAVQRIENDGGRLPDRDAGRQPPRRPRGRRRPGAGPHRDRRPPPRPARAAEPGGARGDGRDLHRARDRAAP